ncbi:MAG TPA: MerR family transcriptional regulator [Stellaceae bacterium]|nr:MerR family transcriptional regulator [Stellaceae bacterium]
MSDAAETASGRRANKRAAVFRTIGEVAEDLDLPAHVLRFWESKFPQLKPLKRGGGRRYYRPEDIALLSRIRQCLYQEGYTIRGVQKLLSEGMIGGTGGGGEIEPSLFPLAPIPARTAPWPARSARRVAEPAPVAARSPAKRAALEEARQELTAVLEMLGGLVRPKS